MKHIYLSVGLIVGLSASVHGAAAKETKLVCSLDDGKGITLFLDKDKKVLRGPFGSTNDVAYFPAPPMDSWNAVFTNNGEVVMVNIIDHDSWVGVSHRGVDISGPCFSEIR